MEDLEDPTGSPVLHNNEEPQGNLDPGDNLQPDIEEEDSTRTPPFADPTADMEARDDDEAPETIETMDAANSDDDDDPESELEELDEAQFDNFDPETANVTVPVAVDETNVAQLGVHKRKRTEAEESERKKKKKEGRREKPKKAKRVRAGGDDEEDDFEGGPELDGKRQRKSKPLGPDGKPIKMARRPRTPENEDDLSPEERRRRALERKMDDALRTNKPSRRGRAGGINLEAAGDAELEQMRERMADACQRDATARAKGEPATHKLTLLPAVTELLNRNTLRSSVVDPEINILEAVRFFLEPADVDAALPNYQIQRELFGVLGKLNVGRDALMASGIGKVVLFYTKSSQPQVGIKRAAEKLTGEWMRVVLGKRKDMRAKVVPTAPYDPTQRPMASQASLPERSAAAAAEKRRQKLAVPVQGNRARVEGTLGSYSVMPSNNLSNVGGVDARRGGAAGDRVFKRMTGRKGKK